MIIVGIALLGFLLLAIIGRRAAQIILISGVAGMVLLFGWNLLRSELRSNAISQAAAIARAASPIPYNCPPSTHPGEDISEGQKIMEAYDCWWAPGLINH